MDVPQARAGNLNQPQLFGWAWTETIGWISLNCFDTNYCDVDKDYGVSVDQTTGKLAGYAWSENIGWISFGDPAGNITYPLKGEVNDPTKSCDKTNCIDGSCSACYNFSNHRLYGWAQIVSLGDDGWIRLDDPSGGQEWGVTEDDREDNGDFSGWAWNGNDTRWTGIGWMSWNGGDGGTYKVDGNPRKLAIASVERTKGEESHSLTVTWNGDVYGETKFYILREDSSYWLPVRYANDGLIIIEDQDKTWFADGSDFPELPKKQRLDMGETYNYKIKACNMFGCTTSTAFSKQTSPIGEVEEMMINTTCAENSASFVLQWRRPYSSPPELPIDYYEGQYCIVTAGQTVKDCKNSDWQPAFYYDSFTNDTVFSIQGYTDIMPSDRYNNYRYNTHFYRIRAVNSFDENYPPTDDQCGDDNGCDDIGSWAYTERAVRPCVPPTQPKYQEVRPK